VSSLRSVLGDVVVTGAAAIVLGGDHGEPACDPMPFLKVRKSRKFMGIQDDLAVVAAGRALSQAGLGASLGERAGLYAAIGFIPFDQAEIDRVVAASIDERGAFSMAKFAGEGIARAHPLLTFRCLPNMPAYHVSVSFDVQGPYVVTYPGPGQLHQAIEEASFALQQGEVDVALVVAVAHQRNFLVTHHFARTDSPVPADRLRDAGTCLVLETATHAKARGAQVRARPSSWSLRYQPPQASGAPRSDRVPVESFSLGDAPLDLDALGELGPAALGVMLARSIERKSTLRHVLRARDGIDAESAWELSP
jgi:3-oxoacyl-(acyl-carrier-protein) synthase